MASPTHQPMLPHNEGHKGANHNDNNVPEHRKASQESDGLAFQLLDEDPLNSSGNSDDQNKLLLRKSSMDSPDLTSQQQSTGRGNDETLTRCSGQVQETGETPTTNNASQPSPHVFSRSYSQAEQRKIQPQDTKKILDRQHSLGNSYITRNSKPITAIQGDKTDNAALHHHQEEPAVLEVDQTISGDSNTKQQAAPNAANQLDRFPLQRQTKMDDHHPTIPSPSSPKEYHPAQKLPNHVIANRLKNPLRATVSLGDKTDAKTSNLNNQEPRWSSLEVPSINVRSEDETCSPDDDNNSSKKTFTLGDQNNDEEVISDLNGYTNNYMTPNMKTTVTAPSGDSDFSPLKLSTHRHSLNLAQRQLSKTVGRSSGIKLKGTYSLDVPERLMLHPSHSLNNVPELERTNSNKSTEFQKVEDKLISNSLTRLDSSHRRRSWAPDTSPRGSKGFVFDKDLLGKIAII